MPKAEPHFDAPALIEEVYKQDVGLRISTNNPTNFKQIVYKAARKLGRIIHIFTCPRAPNALLLLPPLAKDKLDQLKEPADASPQE